MGCIQKNLKSAYYAKICGTIRRKLDNELEIKEQKWTRVLFFEGVAVPTYVLELSVTEDDKPSKWMKFVETQIAFSKKSLKWLVQKKMRT